MLQRSFLGFLLTQMPLKWLGLSYLHFLVEELYLFDTDGVDKGSLVVLHGPFYFFQFVCG